MPWILTRDQYDVEFAVNTDRYDDAYASTSQPDQVILTRREESGEQREQFIRESLESFVAKTAGARTELYDERSE